MNISLPPELEAYIHLKVADGQYQSAGELVSTALRMLQTREETDPLPLDELKLEISRADMQFDRGEYTTYDRDTLKTHFDEIKAAGRVRQSDGKLNAHP